MKKSKKPAAKAAAPSRDQLRLRVDLGDMDAPLEAWANARGQSVKDALRMCVTRLVQTASEPGQSSASMLRAGASEESRQYRGVKFLDLDERGQAEAAAARVGLSLGRALRLEALAVMLNQPDQAGGDERGNGHSEASTRRSPVSLPASPDLRVMVGQVDPPAVRFELRLSESEVQALNMLADSGAFRSAQELVVQVIRSYLTNGALLSRELATELGRCNLSLMRIGTTLHQLFKRLGGGPEGAAQEPELRALRAVVEALERESGSTGKVLQAVQGRWAVQ